MATNTATGSSSAENAIITIWDEDEESSKRRRPVTNEEPVCIELLQSVSRELRIDKWRFLGRTLSLDEAELDEVEHDYNLKGLAEIRLQMLLKWKEKLGRKATIKKLQEALMKINKNDLAQTFATEIREMELSIGLSKERISECSNIIEAHLTSRYNRLKITNDFLFSNKNFYVDEQYAPLSLKLCTPEEVDEEATLNIENIFDGPGENEIEIFPKQILIEGDPGYGKTTLGLKLASDWSNGEEYIKEKFKLVFHYSLKNFDGDLTNLFLEQMKDIEEITDYEKIEAVAKNNILVILDDFNDKSELTQSKLAPLLNGKMCRYVTVILLTVTSELNLQDVNTTLIFTCLEQKFYQKRIQVKGISHVNLEEFFMRRFIDHQRISSKNHVIITKIVHILTTRNDNLHFYYSPLFLIILSELIEKNSDELVQTRTEMFTFILNSLVRRQLLRTNQIGRYCKCDMFDNEDVKAKDYRLLLLQFGKLALNKLYEKQNSFTTDEILFHCNDQEKILQLGFLSQEIVFQENKEVIKYLIHQPFMQQFLASFYISNLLIDHSKDDAELKAIKTLISEGKLLSKNNSLLGPFIVGLMRRKAHVFFTWIQEKFYKNYMLKEFGLISEILMEMEITRKNLSRYCFFINFHSLLIYVILGLFTGIEPLDPADNWATVINIMNLIPLNYICVGMLACWLFLFFHIYWYMERNIFWSMFAFSINCFQSLDFIRNLVHNKKEV